MVEPSALAHRLRGTREIALGRAALSRHLAGVGPAAFARELDELARLASEGFDPARDAMVAVSSFLAHAQAGAAEAPLAELTAVAGELGLERAGALFGGRSGARALPRRGRLPEVSVAASASVSGLPARREPSSSPEEWRAMLAYLRAAPARRASFMRSRIEPLRRHHDPRLVARLLDQPWLSTSDVVVMASRRPTVPSLQLAIATRDRWLERAPVRRALSRNPFTPTGLALALAATVPRPPGPGDRTAESTG